MYPSVFAVSVTDSGSCHLSESPSKSLEISLTTSSSVEFFPYSLVRRPFKIFYLPKKGRLENYIQLFDIVVFQNPNLTFKVDIIGYFKKNLSPGEKRELGQIIEDYHGGLIPLIAPVTLINHYVRKYDELYLKTQYYLKPHPIELMLRNHA